MAMDVNQTYRGDCFAVYTNIEKKNTVDYLVFILAQSLKPCDFFRGESVVFCHVNEVTFGLLGPGCR